MPFGTSRKCPIYLWEMGIDEFDRHVMLATGQVGLTLTTILVRKEVFSPEQIRSFEEQVSKIPSAVVRHVPGDTAADHPVEAVIHLDDDDLSAWLDDYAYDVSPATDDRPFRGHRG